MLTQARIREAFEYWDGKLYWKIAINTRARVGFRAGGKTPLLPYWRMQLDGNSYQEHRLIFLYFHGYIPKNTDHINDDLTDEGIKSNKIENLRSVSKAQNIQKSPKTWSSTTKYRGTAWNKSSQKWQAQICVNYRLIYLGLFDTIEGAAQAYDIAAKKRFGEYCYQNFPEDKAALSTTP